MNIVYKVMAIEDDGESRILTSEVAKGAAKVIYQEGVRVVAPIPGSKLFVFLSEQRAIEYGRDDVCEIWCCESNEPVLLQYCSQWFDGGHIADFWEGNTPRNERMCPPWNTAGVDWLIPIERVWPLN